MASLVRTSFWNGIAVAIRMATALALNKILAVYVGPAGYAIIGQFQNALSIAITFATGAMNTGVTKYTAEYFDHEERQHSLWRTAGTIMFITSVTSAATIALFRYPLARFFLKDEQFASIFLWLGAGLIFISFNGLLLAMLNGKKELRRFVVSNIAGSIVGLVVTGLLAWQYGLYGALVALSINQAIVFLATLQQTLGAPWFRLRFLFGRVEMRHFVNLGKYVLMAATSAAVVPISQILIRNHLIAEFGTNFAGYWDAMWRISMLYLTLVTTTLSLYYLPRISEIRRPEELRAEIWQTYRIILPLVAGASGAIYLLRDILIPLLFTEAFLPMGRLFGWQLAGDVVKIAGWLLAFVMLGKAMVTLFVVTEIAFAALFWAATVVLTKIYGFEGVAMAHFATYAAYLATMWYFIIHKNRAMVELPAG